MEKVHHVKHAQSAATKAGRTILYRQNNNYSFVGTMAPKSIKFWDRERLGYSATNYGKLSHQTGN